MKEKIIVLIFCTLLTATVFLPDVMSQRAINKQSNQKTEHEFFQGKCAFSGEGPNLDNLATTPTIDLSGVSSPILEINTEIIILPMGSGDYGYIKISKNGGSDWTILKTIQGYTPDWVTWEIDLSNWSYPNILIAFEFTTESDSISDGWFIQQIVVKGLHDIVYTEDFSGYDAGDPWGEWTITVQLQPPNAPPNTPTITGQTSGKPGTTYYYTFNTMDLDGDMVFYYIDWGDGTNTGWIGLYESGEIVTKSHNWSEQGTYALKAKAKDIHGKESKWGSLEVTMPLNQPQSQPIVQQYSKPLFLKVLQKLLNNI
jgi:hypothetical protein